MAESVEERNERIEKENKEHYTKLTDEANEAAVKGREDEPDSAETEEDYNLRVTNVPGVFGTNTAQELAQRNGVDSRVDESSDEADREETLLTSASDRLENEDAGDIPVAGEADEMREARQGAGVDPSGQTNPVQGGSALNEASDEENSDDEVEAGRPSAREVIAKIKKADTVEEVDLALEDDDRKSVKDAAEKRREELAE